MDFLEALDGQQWSSSARVAQFVSTICDHTHVALLSPCQKQHQQHQQQVLDWVSFVELLRRCILVQVTWSCCSSQGVWGCRAWAIGDLFVRPYKVLRLDVVVPAPFLQFKPSLIPGGSGVLADPSKIWLLFFCRSGRVTADVGWLPNWWRSPSFLLVDTFFLMWSVVQVPHLVVLA